MAPQKSKLTARQRREALAANWPSAEEQDRRGEIEDLFEEAQSLGGGERWMLGAVLGVDDHEGLGGLTGLSRPEQSRVASGLCPRCGSTPASGRVQCADCITYGRLRYQRRCRHLGTGGREQGGFARARNLTRERRKEIGRAAAKGRWGYAGSAPAMISREAIYARFDVRSTKTGYIVTDRQSGKIRPGRMSNRSHVESWCARTILQSAP
jgi:hypothetical protein